MSFPGETRVIKLYFPVSLDSGVVIDEVTMRDRWFAIASLMPKTAATKKRKKPA